MKIEKNPPYDRSGENHAFLEWLHDKITSMKWPAEIRKDKAGWRLACDIWYIAPNGCVFVTGKVNLISRERAVALDLILFWIEEYRKAHYGVECPVCRGARELVVIEASPGYIGGTKHVGYERCQECEGEGVI